MIPSRFDPQILKDRRCPRDTLLKDIIPPCHPLPVLKKSLRGRARGLLDSGI
jgi:hypothetical protein